MLKLISESSETFDCFKPCNNETTYYLSYKNNKEKRMHGKDRLFFEVYLNNKDISTNFGDENHESKPIEFQDLEKVRW